MMMTSNTTNLNAVSSTFLKRLQELNTLKDGLQAKINQGVEQLQVQLSNGPKKNRDTIETLDKKIEDLEKQRTTTSLKLSDEKKILRQIAAAKREKIQIEEYKEHENVIKDKKAKLEQLRYELRNVTAQIAELEGALANVKLAKRLDCSVDDLVTHVIDCPNDKLGMIIGKNGSNLKQIEKESGCMVDVDKVKCQVHLRGSEAAIKMVTTQLENIIFSTDVEVKLSPALCGFLTKRLSKYTDLQNRHPDVKFSLPKDFNIMILRGKPNVVSSAHHDITNMNVISENLRIPVQLSGVIVGKGGVTIKQLSDDFDVGIDLNKENDEFSNAEIYGLPSQVRSAVDKIKDIIHHNEDIETAIVVSSMTRKKLLSDSGKLIKELESEITNACDSNSVFIRFEKLSDEAISQATFIATVKAPRFCSDKAVSLVKQGFDVYEDAILKFQIDVDIVPSVIGKRGAKINELRKLADDADIDLDKATGMVMISTSDEEAKHKIKSAIDDIVAQNQSTRVSVPNSMNAIIFGSSGKDFRDKLQAMDVTLDQDFSRLFIILRGSSEKIAEATPILREFIDSNYCVDLKVHVDDEDVLFQGGSGSFSKKMENDHNVSIKLLRSSHTVVIRGKEENVKIVEKSIERFLYGGEGNVVRNVFVPSEIIGAIIGKGGSNLSKLESTHGVKLNIRRISKTVAIRGEEDRVQDCTMAIYKIISNANVSAVVPINEEMYVHFSKPNKVKNVVNDIDVSVSVTRNGINIRGLYANVLDAKALLEEYATGTYKSYLILDPFNMEQVKDESHLQVIRESSNADVTVDDNIIGFGISGKKSNVRKAKLLLLDYIEMLTPSTFARLKVAKPFITKNILNMSDVMMTASCQISLDRDLNSILVQSASSTELHKTIQTLETIMKEYEDKVFVYKVDYSESWIFDVDPLKDDLLKNKIQSDTKCVVEISKQEFLITISSSEGSNISKAKELLYQALKKVRKENALFVIPEPDTPHFVGKSGSNMKSIIAKYGVTINRVKKQPNNFIVSGSETAVNEASSYISSWLREREFQTLMSARVDSKEIGVDDVSTNNTNAFPQDVKESILKDGNKTGISPSGRVTSYSEDGQSSKLEDTAIKKDGKVDMKKSHESLFNLLATEKDADYASSNNSMNGNADEKENGQYVKPAAQYYTSSGGFTVRL